MIVTITGPSAAGKSRLLRNLIHADPSIKPILSMTTRAMRMDGDEVPGEYRHVDMATFKAEFENQLYLKEYEVHGNLYATYLSDIYRAFLGGVHVAPLYLNALKDWLEYARLQGKADQVCSLYLHVDDEGELRRRLTKRAGQNGDIERRISDCRSWTDEARQSGIPFHFLSAVPPQEEVCASALAHIRAFSNSKRTLP